MKHKTFKEQLKYIIEHKPEKIHSILHRIKEDFGDEIEDYFFCHITDHDMYNEAVSYFINFNGTKGAHWSPEAVKVKAGIDFEDKEYTCLDYSYMVNKIYSHIGDFTPEDHIHKYAKRLLEDEDYPGDASERAYHDAIKMIEHFRKG
jgi:hypothetical protein